MPLAAPRDARARVGIYERTVAGRFQYQVDSALPSLAETPRGGQLSDTGIRQRLAGSKQCATAVNPEIRPFRSADTAAIIGLFRQFMTELTPPHLREEFGHYVETAVQTELSRIGEYYFGAPGQGFWVAETEHVIGMVGVERLSNSQAELRRMAVDAAFRRRGIARRLLQVAEAFCRDSGYESIVLSTSELQVAAMRLYEASGYRSIGTETATAQSHKTVGAGVVRRHYEKSLRRA